MVETLYLVQGRGGSFFGIQNQELGIGGENDFCTSTVKTKFHMQIFNKKYLLIAVVPLIIS